jgi:hypothetical protein
MPLPAERALRKLGRDLALARRKRGISTNDIAVALTAAERFGLKAAESKKILREVFTAISGWRKTGRQLRLKASTLDAYDTQQTVEMWSSPDFSQLTTQRHEQVFIGNSADLAYVPAPAPEHGFTDGLSGQWILECVCGKEIPVDPRQRISKISEPLAPEDFVLPAMVCARVG